MRFSPVLCKHRNYAAVVSDATLLFRHQHLARILTVRKPSCGEEVPVSRKEPRVQSATRSFISSDYMYSRSETKQHIMLFLSAHLRSDTSLAESRLQSRAKVRLYAEHGRNNSTANSSTNKRQNDAESGICSQRRNLTGGRIYSSSSNLPWMCQRSPASSRWLRILPTDS